MLQRLNQIIFVLKLKVVRFFINFSFKGTNYRGWQSQSNADSIQGEMEIAMSTLLNMPIRLVASGRTDSGVHA